MGGATAMEVSLLGVADNVAHDILRNNYTSNGKMLEHLIVSWW